MRERVEGEGREGGGRLWRDIGEQEGGRREGTERWEVEEVGRGESEREREKWS